MNSTGKMPVPLLEPAANFGIQVKSKNAVETAKCGSGIVWVNGLCRAKHAKKSKRKKF